MTAKDKYIQHFDELISLVESGLTISDACIKLGDPQRNIYRYLTKEQKDKLNKIKLSKAKYGRGNSWNGLLPNIEDELNF